MNELIQKNLKDVGIDVDLQPIEWNSLTQRFRIGFTGENAGVNALNISFNFLEPFSGFGRFFHSKSVPPTSVNIMPFVNPESDKLLADAEKTFDLTKQDARCARRAGARAGGGRGPVDLRRPRPQSPRDERQGQGLRAATKLVRRSHASQRREVAPRPCGGKTPRRS